MYWKHHNNYIEAHPVWTMSESFLQVRENIHVDRNSPFTRVSYLSIPFLITLNCYPILYFFITSMHSNTMRTACISGHTHPHIPRLHPSVHIPTSTHPCPHSHIHTHQYPHPPCPGACWDRIT